mgnify:CR=1 FL=1
MVVFVNNVKIVTNVLTLTLVYYKTDRVGIQNLVIKPIKISWDKVNAERK